MSTQQVQHRFSSSRSGLTADVESMVGSVNSERRGKPLLTRITTYLFCFLVFSVGSFNSLGQEPNAQPGATPDKRAAELRTELELETLRTNLAEQRQKTLAFRAPGMGDDNKPLKGDIKVLDETLAADLFETESVALSYEALSVIAKQIGGSLEFGPGDFNQVVIYGDNDFKTLVQYRIFESQAAPTLLEYDVLFQPPSEKGADMVFDPLATGTRDQNKNSSRMSGADMVFDPLATGTALVRSAIDFISLFRTNTEIANKKVDIEATALGALVANEIKLARPGFKVFFPAAYIPEHAWNPEDKTAVLTQLTRLYAYQAVVKQILADYDQTAAAEKPKLPYHRKIPTMKALNEQVGRLLANYENSQGETTSNRLRELVRAEQLYRMLESDPRTGILLLKIVGAGGSRRITRNLIFGSKIRHSGSAIVEYLLFDKTGALRSSEMFYYHTGFQKMNNTRGSRK